MSFGTWDFYTTVAMVAASLAFIVHVVIDVWRATVWVGIIVMNMREDYVQQALEEVDFQSKRAHIDLTISEEDMLKVGRLTDGAIFRAFEKMFEARADENDWFEVRLLAVNRENRSMKFEVRRKKHEF